MNVSEYISSGILEVYVLGELPPAEAAEVEDMAASHAEVRAEILQIQEAYESLANQLPVAPRASLKDEILDRLAPVDASETPTPASLTTELTTDTASATQAPKTGTPTDASPVGKQRSMRPFQFGIAASWLITALSLAAAIYFLMQWRETEQQLLLVQTQNQATAEQYQTASQRAERLEEDLSIVSSPNFKAVALAGTDAFPDNTARVYWNQQSSQVYLSAGTLPPPPDGRQYQLWAIVDDKPVSAGLLSVAAEGDEPSLQAMSSDISAAAAFAITLEPRGGSESPTLEAMYVMGAVADAS